MESFSLDQLEDADLEESEENRTHMIEDSIREIEASLGMEALDLDKEDAECATHYISVLHSDDFTSHVFSTQYGASTSKENKKSENGGSL